jgi:hypothetical protein
MLRFEAAKQNKAKPKNEEIYFKTSANFTGFANCRRLCYSKFSSWNLRLNKIKKFMKIQKFLFIFSFIIICISWAFVAGAFSSNFVWQSDTQIYSEVLEPRTTINFQIDEEIGYPFYILGVKVVRMNYSTSTDIGFGYFNIACSSFIEGQFGVTYGEQPFPVGEFTPMALQCGNENTMPNFISLNNEFDDLPLYVSIFYTTSTPETATTTSVYNGFSYGEIVMSLFLFLTFMAVCGLLFIRLFIIKK